MRGHHDAARERPATKEAPHYDGPVTSGVTTWFAARWSSPSWRAITLIVVAVLLANGAFVILGHEANPIWWTSAIAARTCSWTCGLPSVDPNVGFITQPQGHLAAMNLLHGHLPWWNYFEGVGQPLAGEMQSASLLPLVVLFLLPAGILMFHLSLQIIAGVSTYFLVRRLGVANGVASVAAILFALNGTFAWIGNAVINPVAFLPMIILGIEIVLERTGSDRRAGWTVLALGVALSIYGGFPETAYLDGLFAVGWAMTRVFSLDRPRRVTAATRLCLGAGVGVALSLPILVAFYDFVREANVGGHFSAGLGGGATTYARLNLLINPYLGGALLGGPGATPRNLLGYFTAPVLIFAVVGARGVRHRGLRWFLSSWVVVGLAGAVDLVKIRHLLNLIPGVGDIAFARYIWPTTEFAVIVLAALGVDAVLTRGEQRRRAQGATAGVAALLVLGVAIVPSVAGPSTGSDRTVVIIMATIPFIACAVLGYSLLFSHAKVLSRLVLATLVVESMLFFAVPTFRNPSSIHVATGSIGYLQKNQGLNRFISLGVLTPNWGAQFSLYEINAIDLPIPSSFTSYIHANLADSLAVARKFTLPFTSTSQDDVAAHLANYEALGVAYVLTTPKALDPTLADKGLTLVAHDSRSNLYRLPQPAAFYSTELATCVISAATIDHVEVTCPAPTTLHRLELAMAGWSAHVNGADVALTSPNALTQSVAIPAGTSHVSFDYLPPHERAAAIAALLALGAMASTWLPRRRRRDERENRHAPDPEVRPGPDGFFASLLRDDDLSSFIDAPET